MGIRMQIEAVCFCGAVIATVWWTRLLYYDGLRQQFVRLKRHCVMQAAMIVGISTWAVAVGFNFQSTIVSKERTIEQLTAGKNLERFTDQISDVVAVKTFEVIRPDGTKVSWTSPATTTADAAMRMGDTRCGGKMADSRRGFSSSEGSNGGRDRMPGEFWNGHVF